MPQLIVTCNLIHQGLKSRIEVEWAPWEVAIARR